MLLINITAQCDKCGKRKSLLSTGSKDMNRRLRTLAKSNHWFANDESHYCNDCVEYWPYRQDEDGNELITADIIKFK